MKSTDIGSSITSNGKRHARANGANGRKKIKPQANLEAERALLGAILLDNRQIPRIRALRKRKRIRQKQLAQMVGITPGALTNFEKGRRRISLDWLQKIADALDTPMAYFVEDGRGQRTITPGDARERRWLGRLR